MARRVFFSFHYHRDIWRANQVRNVNALAESDVAGFFDHSEYEEAKKQGDEGIRQMILKHLKDTTVTVVLIGSHTADRPWVKYEVEQSLKRKNGFLGIYIHHLKNQDQETSPPGRKPSVPAQSRFPAYEWDENLNLFRNAIEASGKRADAWRAEA